MISISVATWLQAICFASYGTSPYCDLTCPRPSTIWMPSLPVTSADVLHVRRKGRPGLIEAGHSLTLLSFDQSTTFPASQAVGEIDT